MQYSTYYVNVGVLLGGGEYRKSFDNTWGGSSDSQTSILCSIVFFMPDLVVLDPLVCQKDIIKKKKRKGRIIGTFG